MKEVKMAIVEMAQGIKECKERIQAIEDSRRGDLGQLTEKLNLQVRKMTKVEKVITLLKQTNYQGRS